MQKKPFQILKIFVQKMKIHLQVYLRNYKKFKKHLSSATLTVIKNYNSNNLFIKDNDPSNSNIINQKDYSSLNNDDNSEINNNLPFWVYNNQNNKNKKYGFSK